MSRHRLGRAAALAAVLSLAAAGGAQAAHDRGAERVAPRALHATTDQNQLLRFNARSPQVLRDVTAITGLPSGTTLRGIDFRPATGDLYGVGSDSTVYRVNPRTGIAVAEGPAFAPGLAGAAFGVDFNPTVDKIRVTSDAGENLRLNVDEGTLLAADRPLGPGMPRIVGSAYTASGFSATRPTATTLYALDAARDTLFVQNPPNDGTLTDGRRLRIDVQDDAGFDIAGPADTGYVATRGSGPFGGARLYTLDPRTGRTRDLGRIGGARRLVVTGLAAWQG